MSSNSAQHSAFLLQNGELWMTGWNYYGQLGVAINNRTNTPTGPQKVPINGTVKQVAAGQYHSAVVTTDGNLYTMGWNYYGQLGAASNYGTDNSTITPVLVMSDVKEVACGYLHTVVLKHNGDVYTFGYNGNGQLGNGTLSNAWSPQKIRTGGAVKVGAGYTCSFVIADAGTLYSCGSNNYGELGLNTAANYSTLTKTAITNVKSVDSGLYYTLILKNDGYVYGIGRNYYGSLGISLGYRTNNFVYLPQFVQNNVKQIACGRNHSALLKNTGELVLFGENSGGQLGVGNATDSWAQQLSKNSVKTVALGYNHSLCVGLDGKVYGTGINTYYQTGSLKTTGNITAWADTGITGARALMGAFTSNVILQGETTSTSFHKEDVVIHATVDHLQMEYVKYRILVNGTQQFPVTGWTADQPTPFDLTRNLVHTNFVLGSNFVVLEAMDTDGEINSFGLYIAKKDTAPTISATTNSSVIHKQNVRLDVNLGDPDGDRIQYRVLLNSVQKFPSSGFSELINVPATLGFVLNNADFNIGSNSIKVEVKDDLGVQTDRTIDIIKTNTLPAVTGKVLGVFVDAAVSDVDGDTCKYLIKVNGIQVYPTAGYTELQPTPFTIKYRIPDQFIKKNLSNLLRIEVIDELDATKAFEVAFQGVYSGLLFCDATESFYSTDFGDILRYLDFGTVVAGQTTQAERIWVKNTLGYPIDNIQLWVDQRELDGVETVAEISGLDAPFQNESRLAYNGTFNHGDKVSFYVRVRTSRQSNSGGMFDVRVKADPK